MSTGPKHTPLPWKVQGPNARGQHEIVDDHARYFGVIAEVWGENNAALIIGACNSHAALLAVVTEAKALCENILERGSHDNWKGLNRAIAALDKVKGASK